MRKIICGIYIIKNKINNKIYIGSSVDINDRWRCHIKELKKNTHHSSKLQNSWNKYGNNNFEFLVMEECDKNCLIEREQFYLEKLLKANTDFNYFNLNGFNILVNANNTLGYVFNEDSKQQMSDTKAKKGKLIHNDFNFINMDSLYHNNFLTNGNKEHLDKSNPFYGKKHSEESKKIMSEKKRGANNMFYGTGPMLGKKMSDESKMKNAISHTGKNNKKSKKVYQYDLNNNFIKEWDSVGVLCAKMKISVGNISNCCNGKRRTGYGFIWRYEKL